MARTQAADYAKRRERIVDSAARLFAERGFLGASISRSGGSLQHVQIARLSLLCLQGGHICSTSCIPMFAPCSTRPRGSRATSGAGKSCARRRRPSCSSIWAPPPPESAPERTRHSAQGTTKNRRRHPATAHQDRGGVLLPRSDPC